MRRVRKAPTAHQSATVADAQVPLPIDDGTVLLSMIQALIPLGLKAVEEALQRDVTALAGARYAHGDGTPGVARWGQQRGSIYLADQKIPITVPRVRDLHAGTELPLATYAQLQAPRAHDVGLFRRVLAGVSTREYEAAAEEVPEAFGIAKSSVSRRFIRASADALRQFHTRRHDDREWLVLLLDGKTFAEDQVVIALGVTTDGEKRVLGLVQTATENKKTCAAFVRELVERGFAAPKGLLVVLDGAKGLRAAVRDVFGDDVAVQRCQWHKRENVLSYLPKSRHAGWRRKLSAAYAHGAYADAKRALQRLVAELTTLNESAARSLEEGLKETLTLHRLALHEDLRRSLHTTNLIESIMAHDRTQNTARRPLADQRSEATLVCGDALTNREKLPPHSRAQTLALAANRVAEQTPPHRCMSSVFPAFTRISTETGTHPLFINCDFKFSGRDNGASLRSCLRPSFIHRLFEIDVFRRNGFINAVGCRPLRSVWCCWHFVPSRSASIRDRRQ